MADSLFVMHIPLGLIGRLPTARPGTHAAIAAWGVHAEQCDHRIHHRGGSGRRRGRAASPDTRVHFEAGRYNPDNNVNGGGRVSCAQFANPARVQTDQAFESRTTDVVIVKFGFVEGELTPGRAITIDTPAIGINRTLWNGMYVPNVRRFAEPNEANASIQAAACTVPATVHVLPSPGAAALAAMGLLRACRRQPRTSQAQM